MSDSNSSPTPALPPRKTGFARLIAATHCSMAGFKATFQNEEAFRLEIFGFLVLAPVALWLGESRVDKVLLIGSLLLVLLVEMINSAIEAVVDRGGSEYNELAGRAKDMGSAAVLTCLILAVFVWAMLLL